MRGGFLSTTLSLNMPLEGAHAFPCMRMSSPASGCLHEGLVIGRMADVCLNADNAGLQGAICTSMISAGQGLHHCGRQALHNE